MKKRYPNCIMATCCIPWDRQGNLAEDIFRMAIQGILEKGTRHVYVFGTAGEGYGVSESQFDRIVGVFNDEMRRGNAEPMVGVINLSVAVVCDRIERARNIGVRNFQISLPSWGALSDPELQIFFDTICGRYPDCQFMHYNLPRARRLVTGEEYGTLSKTHSNLVATKNSGDSLSHLRGLMDEAPELQHFFSETGYLYGSLFGECGILASLIMNWPKLKALWQAGQQRDVDTMIAIQREIDVVLQTLFEVVPSGRIDGTYDKLFQKMHHPEFPLRLLPPYVGSSDEEFHEFVGLLRQRVPEWVPESPTGTLRRI